MLLESVQNRAGLFESLCINNIDRKEFDGFIKNALKAGAPIDPTHVRYNSKSRVPKNNNTKGSQNKYSPREVSEVEEKKQTLHHQSFNELQQVYEENISSSQPKYKTVFNNYVDEKEEIDKQSEDNILNDRSTIKFYTGTRTKVLEISDLYPKMIATLCEMSQKSAVEMLVHPFTANTSIPVLENISSILKIIDNLFYLVFEFQLYRTQNNTVYSIF